MTQSSPGATMSFLLLLTPCISLVSGCLRAFVSWFPTSCLFSIAGRLSLPLFPSQMSISQWTSGAGRQPAPAASPGSLGPHQVSGKRAGPSALPSEPQPSACAPSPLTSQAPPSGAHISLGPSEELAVDSGFGSIADSTQQFTLFSSASWKALQSLHLAGNASDLVSQTGVPSTCPAAFPGHTSRGTGALGALNGRSRPAGRSNPPYLEFKSVH